MSSSSKNVQLFSSSLFRATLWGLALYTALGHDHSINLKLNILSYLLATAWAYFDGVVSQRDWWSALKEGLFLHLLAVQVSNLIGISFGW